VPPVGGAEAMAAYVKRMKEANPRHVVVGAGDFIAPRRAKPSPAAPARWSSTRPAPTAPRPGRCCASPLALDAVYELGLLAALQVLIDPTA
jgi:hypothetical protein